MEYLITTPAGTYRLQSGTHDADDLIALLDHYISEGVLVGPELLRALSRQQVLAKLGRPTFPESKTNPFPGPAMVIGDDQATRGFTRGWLDGQITAWQDTRMQAVTAAEPEHTATTEPPAAQPPAAETAAPDPEPEPEPQPQQASGDSEAQTADEATETAEHPGTETNPRDNETAAPAVSSWQTGSRLWTGPGAADERVVLVSCRGVVTPSGWVLGPALPAPANVARFVAWHWRKKPSTLPQMWFTAEAMEAFGMAVEDADPAQVGDIVAETFGCTVSWHQSGFFTCRWGSQTTADGDGDTPAAGAGRSAQLVFIPWLPLDPSDARPGDLGVAGIENTETELPEDEEQAVQILAERIAWLCTLGDGVVPGSRWSTVGAAFADVKRRASTVKSIKAGPLPEEVRAAQSDLDPDLHEGKRPHHISRSEVVVVETDQRAAYLASAGTLQLGYGTPTRVDRPDPELLVSQKPSFALWRVTTPAGSQIKDLDRRLPLPNEYMQWDEPRTFWTTTRGAQHLIAPIDNGGTGLAPEALGIDAAWIWPAQTQLLRGWATEIRNRLNEAIAEGRQDRIDMLKAMYKAYLGRTASAKWSPRMGHHHQPVHYAAIQADVRFRALRYAVGIRNAYGWYPVAADVDAWTYWLPLDTDLSVLEEEPKNGKYRVKTAEYPPGFDQSGPAA